MPCAVRWLLLGALPGLAACGSEVGQAARLSDGDETLRQPRLLSSLDFNCKTEGPAQRVDWSKQHAAWCCEVHEIGCFDERRVMEEDHDESVAKKGAKDGAGKEGSEEDRHNNSIRESDAHNNRTKERTALKNGTKESVAQKNGTKESAAHKRAKEGSEEKDGKEDERNDDRHKNDTPDEDNHEEDKHKDDKHRDDKHGDDKHTDDKHTADKHRDDKHRDDKHKADKHTYDKHTADKHKDDKHKDDKHKDDRHKDDREKTRTEDREDAHREDKERKHNRHKEDKHAKDDKHKEDKQKEDVQKETVKKNGADKNDAEKDAEKGAKSGTAKHDAKVGEDDGAMHRHNLTGFTHLRVDQCFCSKDTDVLGGNIKSLPVHSQEECCHACASYPRCEVSVFLGSMCYMKKLTKPIKGSIGRTACFPSADKVTAQKAMSQKLKGGALPLKEMKPVSCKVYGCSGYRALHSCQCNPQCEKFRNCCYDYAESNCPKPSPEQVAAAKAARKRAAAAMAQPSCKNYGCVSYVQGHACQCNEKCKKYKNCCSDYRAHCSAGAGDSNSTEEHQDERDHGKSKDTAHSTLVVLKRFEVPSAGSRVAAAWELSARLLPVACCVLVASLAALSAVAAIAKRARPAVRGLSAEARIPREAFTEAMEQGEDQREQLLCPTP